MLGKKEVEVPFTWNKTNNKLKIDAEVIKNAIYSKETQRRIKLKYLPVLNYSKLQINPNPMGSKRVGSVLSIDFDKGIANIEIDSNITTENKVLGLIFAFQNPMDKIKNIIIITTILIEKEI